MCLLRSYSLHYLLLTRFLQNEMRNLFLPPMSMFVDWRWSNCRYVRFSDQGYFAITWLGEESYNVLLMLMLLGLLITGFPEMQSASILDDVSFAQLWTKCGCSEIRTQSI